MAKKRSKKKQKGRAGADGSSLKKKGGLLIYVPAFCSLIGTLMLLVVIGLAVPLTVPNYFGYEVYNVVSGSMEPAIPIGSVIYVKHTDPVDIKKGDIIAFESGESIIMHRVVDNKVVEGTFTTKGDANETEDMNEVPYTSLVGLVVRHVPVMGQLLTLFGSSFGRICMICFAACGALLNILGGRFRDAMEYEREEEARREELLAEARKRLAEQEAEEKKAAESDTSADSKEEKTGEPAAAAEAEEKKSDESLAAAEAEEKKPDESLAAAEAEEKKSDEPAAAE